MSLGNSADVKAEIQTDPVAIGYGAWTTVADDLRIHGLMSDPTKRTIQSVAVAASRVIGCFDPTEFAALTQVQLLGLMVMLMARDMDFANANVRNIFQALFPAAGPTRTALAALWTAQVQKQSRMQELGWSLVVGDVTWARTH